MWESKLLVVGEGGVGKTELIQALHGRSFNADQEGTVGIKISELNVTRQADHTMMRLNAWDFAGQDFNHATHQLFFSNRSLFLLVWNARHGYEQGKLFRWLENIKVRSPRAKVILVATHIDEPHSDYPFKELQKKYPQIVDEAKVSNKTREGFPDLHDKIQRHANDLPLMGLYWPTEWLNATHAVRLLKETTKDISRHALTQVMQKNGSSKTMPVC